MNIINTQTGDVQLNTPYSTDDDLQNCGLTLWHIATDDEVVAYKTVHADEIKQAADNVIISQIATLEATQARALREMAVNPNDIAKNKLTDIDNQITELRKQLKG
jgi:hypothetical protein